MSRGSVEEWKQVATPVPAVASGSTQIYAKTDGRIYAKTGSVETIIGLPTSAEAGMFLPQFAVTSASVGSAYPNSTPYMVRVQTTDGFPYNAILTGYQASPYHVQQLYGITASGAARVSTRYWDTTTSTWSAWSRLVDDVNAQTIAGAKTFTDVAAFSAGATGISAFQVGLGNVNNTSDLAKPVSTATNVALSTKAGVTLVQIFTVSGTWTKPTGAVTVSVVAIGSGGAGGTGRRGALGSVRCGGGGGAGGSISRVDNMPAAGLPATVAVTVAPSTGGSSGTLSDNTNGNPGSTGAASFFGTYCRAGGGFGGGAGGALSGPGGAGSKGMWGSSDGGDASTTGGNGANAVDSLHAAGSGGAGGGQTAGNSASDGGDGGGITSQSATLGGAGGTATNPGVAGTSQSATMSLPAGGGGGGGYGTAGRGGNGGAFWGGGGGGAGGVNNGNAGAASGSGGQGVVIVATNF